jgi:hypothetical protein
MEHLSITLSRPYRRISTASRSQWGAGRSGLRSQASVIAPNGVPLSVHSNRNPGPNSLSCPSGLPGSGTNVPLRFNRPATNRAAWAE